MLNFLQQTYTAIPTTYRKHFCDHSTFALLIAEVEAYRDIMDFQFVIDWPIFTIRAMGETRTCDMDKCIDGQRYIYRDNTSTSEIVNVFINDDLLPVFRELHSLYRTKQNISQSLEAQIKYHTAMFDEYKRLRGNRTNKEDNAPFKIWQLYQQLEQFILSLPQTESLSTHDKYSICQKVKFHHDKSHEFHMELTDILWCFDEVQAYFFYNCWQHRQENESYKATTDKILNFYQSAAAERECELSFNRDKELALFFTNTCRNGLQVKIYHFSSAVNGMYDLIQEIFACPKRSNEPYDADMQEIMRDAINMLSEALRKKTPSQTKP